MCIIPPISSRHIPPPLAGAAQDGNLYRNWIFARRAHFAWQHASDLVRLFVRVTFVTFAVLVLLFAGGTSNGQVRIEPIHGWQDPGTHPAAGLVLGSDGNFYGTTDYGGVNGTGTVFRISAAGEYTALHSFAYTDSITRNSNLVQGHDGYFYGTHRSAGANAKGAVFRISTSGEYTLLHAFDGSDGRSPIGGLVQGSDGYFYGTAESGGASGGGTIFRISAEGKHEILHSFTDRASWSDRGTLVQGHDGHFYGTRALNGVNGVGMIFRISMSGEYAVLHSFGGSDGRYPDAGLVQGRDGYLYGTTNTGGLNERGTVFRISVEGVHEVLYSFTALNGGYPFGALMEGRDGYFYGTTGNGQGPDASTIFRISAKGEHEVLHTFSRTDGLRSEGKLVEGNDGYLYGTVGYGGSSAGAIFRVSRTGEYSVLRYLGRRAGYTPVPGLVHGRDGYFYGATSDGGLTEKGTIYRLSVTGAYKVLHSFSGFDGSKPYAGLVQGTDGHFYGATSSGGVGGNGTIFRISAAGEHKVLHVFSGSNGHHPSTALVQGADGHFYGTAQEGANLKGTIFRISVAGEYEVLHSFAGMDGSSPAALLRAVDGHFYGTTGSGGANNNGTVFRFSTAGEYEVLHSFTGRDGYRPAALVQGADGYLYGTTRAGGAKGYGTIFRISTAGDLQVLHSFSSIYSGENLVQGNDGYLYGAIRFGGDWKKGGIYRISTAGEYAWLYSFPDNNDRPYQSTLVTGSDGNLWGISSSESTYGGAIFYRVLLAPETLPADRITYSSARLRARVSRAGGTAVQFEYGTDPSMSVVKNTEWITLAEDSNLTMASAAVFELAPNTIYYYWPYVRRADGAIQRGVLQSFTTGLVEPQITVLASKDAAVPGAGTPDSGIPSGAIWQRFGVPAFGGNSLGAFTASLKLSTDASIPGIFSGDPAAPVLVAKKGDPATGLAQGSVFSSFKGLVRNNTGELAFIGTVSGSGKSKQGIWSNAGIPGGKPEWLVASQGSEAAGTSSGAKWKAFTSVALSDSGVICFTATLEPGRGRVTAANNLGLWQAKSSGISLLLREGQDLELDGVTRKVKRFVALSSGQGRFTANGELPVRVIFGDNSQVLLQFNVEGEPEVIAASEDAVSEAGGALFRSFGVPALSQSGTAVFAATLVRGTADVDRSNDSGVFITRNDTWAVVARKGSEAPGMMSKGAPGTFVSFSDPFINAEGQVVFSGTTTGGAKGIWWKNGAEDPLQMIASTAANSVPGVDGARFTAFKSVMLPDDPLAGPVFVAKVEGKGITTANDLGLWTVDSEGILRLIVRKGDIINGKVLRSFTFLSAASGALAQLQNDDAQRRSIYCVFFTDGGQALVSVDLP